MCQQGCKPFNILCRVPFLRARDVHWDRRLWLLLQKSEGSRGQSGIALRPRREHGRVKRLLLFGFGSGCSCNTFSSRAPQSARAVGAVGPLGWKGENFRAVQRLLQAETIFGSLTDSLESVQAPGREGQRNSLCRHLLLFMPLPLALFRLTLRDINTNFWDRRLFDSCRGRSHRHHAVVHAERHRESTGLNHAPLQLPRRGPEFVAGLVHGPAQDGVLHGSGMRAAARRGSVRRCLRQAR